MIVETAVDDADMSRRAAAMVVAQLRAKPDSLLVLPTGATPLGLFRALVAAAEAGDLDASCVRFVTLDDYRGIAADDPRRLLLWLRRALLDPLGVGEDRIVAFDPEGDPEAEPARIEAAIAEGGGIDLAIVGLGPNGHLGFNEPCSRFDSRARRIALTPESIRSNAAYWGSEDVVPREGFTLGLGTLMEARRLVLIASGARKRGILAAALDGPTGEAVPATLLRLHPEATVIADRAALGRD
ncbi:MAG: glucosamine-6-phosphate deaminase [Bauldia sp.]|nr:glucosamine-6-phosphate deaminase [Bauldia sp.]